MLQSVYTAAQGLSAQQGRIDTIANNISNVNTTAFKVSNISFKDALYAGMENPGGVDGEDYNLQRGSGVILASTMQDFSQGTISTTGNNLDFAIEGDGFFKLQDARGEYEYTRNGSFQISVEEDGNYLINGQGYYVMDQNDRKIKLPTDSDEISISEDGVFTFGGQEAETVKLGVYKFPKESGLYSVGGSMFSASPASGEAAAADDYKICERSLEGSNVILADELTELMRAQRLYSLASQALQTADDMEGLAINIR